MPWMVTSSTATWIVQLSSPILGSLFNSLNDSNALPYRSDQSITAARYASSAAVSDGVVAVTGGRVSVGIGATVSVGGGGGGMVSVGAGNVSVGGNVGGSAVYVGDVNVGGALV